MAKYLICDIDGCLVDSSWIWGVVNELKKTNPTVNPFEVFDKNANLSSNGVDVVLVDFIERFMKKSNNDCELLFLTARSLAIKEETINFIKEHANLKDFQTSFRDLNDTSNSVESKKKRLDEILKAGNEVVLALDDDVNNVKMFKDYGIKTVQWRYGFIPQEIIDTVAFREGF